MINKTMIELTRLELEQGMLNQKALLIETNGNLKEISKATMKNRIRIEWNSLQARILQLREQYTLESEADEHSAT